jgi:hypothetical protein
VKGGEGAYIADKPPLEGVMWETIDFSRSVMVIICAIERPGLSNWRRKEAVVKLERDGDAEQSAEAGGS